MFICTCKKEEIEACAKLLCAVYSEAPYHESWNLSDAMAYLERFREIDPKGCSIAKENNEVIGAIFSFSYPWQGGKTICVQELFVSLVKRRQSVARQLLNQISHGEKVGVWLVAHENSEATLFYEKMGFVQKGPYKFRHGIINT